MLVAAFIPILWFFLMHDYQRQRVAMLLDPETDPLGAGYHIVCLKLPLRLRASARQRLAARHPVAAGVSAGTPHRLIFAVLAEELGLIGVLILLALYILLIMRGLWIAAQANLPWPGLWPVV